MTAATEPSSPRLARAGGGDPAALVHALEVHQAELEMQNAELQAANLALRESNEALATARDRFGALYERAPTPYVTVDGRRAIVDVNQAAEAILGDTRDHLVGGTIDVFVDDAGRAGFRAFVDTVFVAGHARCADVVLVHAGAAPVDVQIDGVVLREEGDAPPRCVLAIVDITTRKQAEAARRKGQEEVLAIVSHDLRGPLSAIGLACEALGQDLAPAEHGQCVGAIVRSMAQCERLIKDLLRVAHIESGQLTLELARFDVRELVWQVCRDFESRAAAAGVSLSVEIEDRPQPIVGDRDRLHQVFSNLIGNALVHARGAAVEVSVHPRDAEVVVAVADDGPGIPPDEIPFVFDRFRQGARRRGGAGLGLAIVKGLAEAHHGTATVASQPGHGARFEVALPCSEAPRTPPR
jgi:PAS domain S-box-containing protein